VSRAKTSNPVVRCAIYTRKSTSEGLDQSFNTLDAQRESAEAYIASQKGQGWECLPTRYDDGGFTGGNVERPALKRLLADIEAGKVDVVVCYKVDRLTRSLTDFARLMETLDKHHASFVSVTQSFDTSNSMGRLTLNVLLSFAQFERELCSERTRDKIAAARRKGKWAGGLPVLGYDVVHQPGGNTLAVNPEEADRVRTIFAMYLEHGRVMPVVVACRHLGWTTKSWTAKTGRLMGGKPLSKNLILRILKNPVYLGKVRHHSEIYEGEHEAIVEQEMFDAVQARMEANREDHGSRVCNKNNALLKGLVRCTHCECAMIHHAVSKASDPKAKSSSARARLYRYYVCSRAQKHGWSSCPGASLPAADLERFVVGKIRDVVNQGEVMDSIAKTTVERLTITIGALLADPDEAMGLAENFDALWKGMKREERIDLIRMLIERVDWDPEEETLSVIFYEGVPLPEPNREPTRTSQEEAAA
jgi:site-specific DNA recombinase